MRNHWKPFVREWAPGLTFRLHLALLPLFLFIAVSGIAVWLALQTNASEVIANRRVKELAVEFLELQLMQEDASKTMMLEKDDPKLSLRKIKAYDRALAIPAEIRKLTASPAVYDILNQLSQIEEKDLRPLDTRVLESIGEGKFSAAREMYLKQYEPHRARFERLIQQLCEQAETEAGQSVARMENTNRTAFFRIMIILSLGLLLVSATLILVARWVTKKLEGSASELENGFNKTTESMDQFTQGSNQLIAGANDLIKTIDATRTSVDEIARLANGTLNQAEAAAQASNSVRQMAQEGGNFVLEMDRSVEELRQSHVDIGSIASTVELIAFQTHILSLNAAIEAARAGSSGSAFSVVASEVRSLALRCTEAARETGEKIEVSVRRGEFWVKSQKKIVENLAQIQALSRESDALVNEIAKSSKLQNHQIEAILMTMKGIEEQVHVNSNQAASAQFTAAALGQQNNSLGRVVEDVFVVLRGSSEIS